MSTACQSLLRALALALLIFMHLCIVIDCNNTAIRGLGGLAASFEEVAHISRKVLQYEQWKEVDAGDGDSTETTSGSAAGRYHNRRVGIASSEQYWLKFAAGALQYFLAPEVLRAVWGPGGAAWRQKHNA